MIKKTNEELQYQKISPEEMQKRGILGRLVGICADFINPTRNGRKYPEELWDKVFDSDIMKEKIDAHVVFGELGHPADRTEIDMEKVAVSLAEVPKKGEDGKLRAVFDILNTPNGKILKALCDYGCKMGVSSRGQGDLIQDFDGNEEVDPDTYDCECFDIVCVPAVKEARLNLVTESLTKKKQTLKESLNKVLDDANPEEKKVMLETLDNIGVDIEDTEDIVSQKEEEIKSNNENCGDREVQEQSAVENNEVDMVNELQEALQKNRELETKLIELQEKLSVSYAKEIKLEEELNKKSSSIRKLSLDSKRANALQEKVSKLTSVNEELNKRFSDVNDKVQKLEEKALVNRSARNTLKEDINNKNAELTKLNEAYNSLKEKYVQEKESLNESIAELEKDLKMKDSEYSTKIEKANKLVEKYKRIANNSVDKYISSQALKLGVTSNEIKNRLPESYTFEDIDDVCEDLQGYRLAMNKLPFQINENVRVKATTHRKENLIPVNDSDVVDDSLLRLAGLNK